MEHGVMNILSEWWKKAEAEDKIIQFLVVFLTVSLSLDRTVAVSISTGAALLYIIYDCMKQKSLAGFYSPRRDWLGIAVFLFSVLAASVFLGDMGSIHMALKYIYWTLPFLLIVYFESRTKVKYAVVAGAMLSLVLSFASVLYLYLHGFGDAAGRIGAFDANPNHYAFLLGGFLPVLFCALSDTKLKAEKTFVVLDGIIIVMGLFTLWKTGSRGAMGGLFAGAVMILSVFCHLHKNMKLFLKGLLLCVAVSLVVLIAGIPGGAERLGDKVRLRQLQSCYAMWKDHVVLGIGLNNWESQYSTTYVQAEVIKQEAARRYEEQKAARKKAIEKRNTKKTKAAGQKTAKQQQSVKNAATQTPVAKGEAAKKPVVQKSTAKEETVKKAAIHKSKAKLTAKQKAAVRRKRKAAKKEAARKAAFLNRVLKHEAELPIPHNVVAWFFSTTGIVGGIGYLFFVCYYLWRLYRKVNEEPENWVAFSGLWTFIAVNFHGLFDAGITNKAAARLLYLMLGLALTYSQYKKKETLTENQNG